MKKGEGGESAGVRGRTFDDWIDKTEQDSPSEGISASLSNGWQSGLGLRKAWKFHVDSAKQMMDSFGSKLGVAGNREDAERSHLESVPVLKRRNSTGSIDGSMPRSPTAEGSEAGETRSNPWSPLSKPIAKAFNDGFLQPGRVMGKRLADVWDIHDLFDDGGSHL